MIEGNQLFLMKNELKCEDLAWPWFWYNLSRDNPIWLELHLPDFPLPSVGCKESMTWPISTRIRLSTNLSSIQLSPRKQERVLLHLYPLNQGLTDIPETLTRGQICRSEEDETSNSKSSSWSQIARSVLRRMHHRGKRIASIGGEDKDYSYCMPA